MVRFIGFKWHFRINGTLRIVQRLERGFWGREKTGFGRLFWRGGERGAGRGEIGRR